MGKKQRREAASRERLLDAAGVLGTEPASENWIRSCCCSTPGIRFYCKPVTLVRCREIRGENRFSGRVGGKWLCEMTSAFIIKELRGTQALRLFCGRSAFPPPFRKDKPVSLGSFSGVTGFLFALIFKAFGVFNIFQNHSPVTRFSLFSSPSFSVWPLILRFVRTKSDSRPESYILA